MYSVLTTGLLICGTCHFQSGSLCLFGFFCLQVSSVSNFCPDTSGRTNITGVCGECSQCLGHTGFACPPLPPPAHGICAFPVYTAQASGCSAGSGPWVACTSQV